MANARRGEIEAVIDGRSRRLVLTLGALAELEHAFGVDDLVALAERFGSGRLSALDLIRVVGAGLRGAGEAVDDEAVAAMTAEGGAAGFADIAARLIVATFGASSEPPEGAGEAKAGVGAKPGEGSLLARPRRVPGRPGRSPGTR
jgi:hypothetical protein